MKILLKITPPSYIGYNTRIVDLNITTLDNIYAVPVGECLCLAKLTSDHNDIVQYYYSTTIPAGWYLDFKEVKEDETNNYMSKL